MGIRKSALRLKAVLFGVVMIASYMLIGHFANAQEDKIKLYLFYGNGCPHCHKEIEFLEKLEKDYSNIEINKFEVWNNRENAKIFADVSKEMNITQGGVPTLIIGDEVVVGYGKEETTGNKIKNLINKYTKTGCEDKVYNILNPKSADMSQEQCDGDCDCQKHEIDSDSERAETMIEVPFFGEINPNKFSLPVITALIAGTDGFNPCAMWVLLFLISLLLGMENKRRMWILGIVFIVASGSVYFLFLSAWLNIFLFVGFVFWIRALVAATALGSGIYHIKDYFTNKNGTCKVTGNEKRRKVFDKLKAIATEDRFFVAVFGMILIAVAVNLVELVCSAGLPAVYTQILALADLPTWKYYAYLIFYILVFMADDLLVFFLAMTTMQMTAGNSKYTRYAGLVGGVIMVIIGLLLLFKPGALMFG